MTSGIVACAGFTFDIGGMYCRIPRRIHMSTVKIAITIDRQTLRRVDGLVSRKAFRNRSRAIEEAVAEKLARMERSRLASGVRSSTRSSRRRSRKAWTRSWKRYPAGVSLHPAIGLPSKLGIRLNALLVPPADDSQVSDRFSRNGSNIRKTFRFFVIGLGVLLGI